jgi:O-antigen ligase
MGTAVVLLLWRGRMKLVVPVVIACTIGPLILPHAVVQRFNETHVEGRQVDESTELRYVYWGVAWNDFTKHPLVGMGYHTFYETNPYGRDTHNFFLRELAEKGFIGFLVTVSLFMSMARAGWRAYRDSPPDSLAYALGLGMCGAWPALVVTNLWGDRFTYTVMIAYYWVLLALCLKAREFVLAEHAAATTPSIVTAAMRPLQRHALPLRLRERNANEGGAA